MTGALPLVLVVRIAIGLADDTEPSSTDVARRTIITKYDEMNDVAWRQIKAYTCGDGECLALSSKSPVRLYYGVEAKKKKKLPLRMQLEYAGDDWVGTTKMTFLIDGKRFVQGIPYFDWDHDVWSGGEVHESVDVSVSTLNPALARALCGGKVVKVRFEGQHTVRDYVLEDWQVEALRVMCAEWREPWSVYEARQKREAEEAKRAAKIAEEQDAERMKEALALEARRIENLPELPAKIVAACRVFRACMNSDDRTCYQRTFEPYEAACQEYARLEGRTPFLCGNKSNDACAW
jgi:hypothetical protein